MGKNDDSNLKKFNFGINTAAHIIANTNNNVIARSESPPLSVTPPDKMYIIKYALSGFFKITNEIIELTNILTESPTNINFVTESLLSPQKNITKNAAINAPENPNKA